MSGKIGDLESSLALLDTLIQVFAVLVAIGIVGEVGFGVRHWILNRRLQGLVHFEDQKRQAEIARLNKEAGDARQAAGAAIERAAVAEERAAIANQKAEAEHIARVKLASAIAPRSLAISQTREIVDELRPVANADIHITVEISLGNSGGLGIQIYNALKEAGFSVQLQEASRVLYETSIGGPLESINALNAISAALGKRVPIMGLIGILPPNSPIRIAVGERLMRELPKN